MTLPYRYVRYYATMVPVYKHFKRQRTNYYCGPAVLQIVASALGTRITQDEAAKLAHTNKKSGTSISNLVRVLNKFGTVDAAEHRTVADIKKALAQGRVIIVCFTERHFNWGHYALVVEFKGKNIKLLDPAEKSGTGEPMTVKEFESRWKDPLYTKSVRWAAFVLPTASPRRQRARQNTAQRK